MLNCKLLKGKRPIFAFKVIVITAMNRIIENLKVNNPAIYQILQEQEKQKWEITSGTRYKTVSDTVSANSSIEYNIKSKPNQLCQHGVKYYFVRNCFYPKRWSSRITFGNRGRCARNDGSFIRT